MLLIFKNENINEKSLNQSYYSSTFRLFGKVPNFKTTQIKAFVLLRTYTNVFHFSFICLILTTILSVTKHTPKNNNYESTKYKEEKEEKEVGREISTSIKEIFLLVQQ